jgi:hypothetical protein
LLASRGQLAWKLMRLLPVTRRKILTPQALAVALAASVLAGLLALAIRDAVVRRQLVAAAEAGVQTALAPRATRAEVERTVTIRLNGGEVRIELLVNGHLPRENPWLEINRGDEVRLSLRRGESTSFAAGDSLIERLLRPPNAVAVVRRKP